MSLVPLPSLVIKRSKYKIKLATTKHLGKKMENEMCAPDHGNTEKAPVQVCEYVIPSPPGATKAFRYS